MGDRERVEQHMAALSDAQLIGVLEVEAADYEPWALEIARDELARRRLGPKDVAELREVAVAEQATMAADRRLSGADLVVGFFEHEVLAPVALIAWPFLFLRARSHDRQGNERRAHKLRAYGFFGAMAWVLALVMLFLNLFWLHRP